MALINMVSAVAGLIKVRYLIDKAIIDNIVFRCHYRITSALFFVCCIIVTANNLIGDPISCIHDNAISRHVINTYCWITHTFSLPDHYNRPIGSHIPHPGVAPDLGEKRYHSYYQWVPFVLFFQGVLFYFPHFVWKSWEEGKMRMISDGLRGTVLGMKEQRTRRQGQIVHYLVESLHLHNLYAFGYYFCEILNFINVICNIYFLDLFFGGSFMTYGLDVIKFSNMNQEIRVDPMIAVFPRVTKCTFQKFGPSGTIQKHDALCILALNILNEKIFILIWFWLVILAILSAVTVIYSVTIIFLPSIREMVLRKRFRYGSHSAIATLVQKTQIGDFLLLHLLSQNVNYVIFSEILEEVIARLNIEGRGTPSAPSTIEMSPMYSDSDKFGKDV